MYLKILKGKENHNGLQYHTGLVKDILPFEPEGSCVSGGIYFTTPKHICKFLGYGVWVREVTIPNRARMVQDPEGDKWRANKVVLGTRKHLGKVDTWKWLIKNGTDIHADCDFPLRLTANNGHLEVVKYLVKHGANIHANDDDALRNAAANGHLEVVKYLVEHGANIHAYDDAALRWSARNGHLEVVKYLVEHGADIHACDDAALRWSAYYEHLDVVKYLIENGADTNARDDWAMQFSISIQKL
jgi:predicted small metal-binding protein